MGTDERWERGGGRERAQQMTFVGIWPSGSGSGAAGERMRGRERHTRVTAGSRGERATKRGGGGRTADGRPPAPTWEWEEGRRGGGLGERSARMRARMRAGTGWAALGWG